MQRRAFLLPLFAPLALVASSALWSCIGGSLPASTTSTGAGNGGGGGAGGARGAGGTGATVGAGTGPSPEAGIACKLDNGADPVGFCTQKVVLLGEHLAAFDVKNGVAESWDSTTMKRDVGPNMTVLHDPHDDAAYAAACARYHQSAMTYGDTEITATLDGDLVAIVPLLMTELGTPPTGYAGELYQDLRTAAGGLRVVNRNDLAMSVDMLAEGYGRAIYTVSYAPLGTLEALDAGPPAAGDGGPILVADGVLGTPSGGATAYAPADAATGALALIDLARIHANDDPMSAAAWQSAAAGVLEHLHRRARDGATGLYFAALVTSGDPVHDALAPASPSGPPADALLTEVNARVALALLRAQALVTAYPAALPDVGALPLEARAEALLAALDGTPQGGLWDPNGGPPDGGCGTLGNGYFEGWVPSTQQLLTDKPTRANALLAGALHDAIVMGNGPHPERVPALRTLLADMTNARSGFMTVVDNQSGYFFTVPAGFAFAPGPGDAGIDGGTNPRQMSYFSIANTSAIEGLSELWIGTMP